MTYILVDTVDYYSSLACEELSRNIGKTLAIMHDNEIVHGDLTTSNIMMRTFSDATSSSDYEVTLIDFGLGMMKPNVEDKAVDLYVLERAFTSTHAGSETMVQKVIASYRQASKKSAQVLSKLDQVPYSMHVACLPDRVRMVYIHLTRCDSEEGRGT
jgi:TP53 regulating kinase-like protein